MAWPARAAKRVALGMDSREGKFLAGLPDILKRLKNRGVDHRILFLDGIPNIARYDVIRAGTSVKDQFEHDLKLETNGVKAYNEAIELALKLRDAGSRELMERILTDSEGHVDWLETQLGVIKDIGIENYLSEQLGGGEGK